METLRSLGSILPLSSVSASFHFMLLSSQTGLCGSSVYEVKKRPPPVLGLESNMTAKGLPLDPISMGIDRFGFGSECTYYGLQSSNAQRRWNCFAQILQKCLLNGFKNSICRMRQEYLLLDIMVGN